MDKDIYKIRLPDDIIELQTRLNGSNTFKNSQINNFCTNLFYLIFYTNEIWVQMQNGCIIKMVDYETRVFILYVENRNPLEVFM